MACFVLPPIYFTAYFLAYSRNRRSYSSLLFACRCERLMDVQIVLGHIDNAAYDIEQWSEVRSRSVSRSAHKKPASMLHLPSRIRRM